MTPEVLANAKVLWDYNVLGNPPQKADALFLFGHNDLRVVEYAAGVARQFDFNLVVCTGGIAHQGDVIETGWNRPEADVFTEALLKAGIPLQRILIEREATHTGQNVTLSHALLAAHRIPVTSGLIIHKPYMERRALATAQAQWPGVAWYVNSPPFSLAAYLEGQNHDNVIHALVGDTARIEPYGELGYITRQRVPAAVKTAVANLIALGYTKHLPKLEKP